MQTPKANRAASLEVPQRRSPATSRTARQLKPSGADSDSVGSPNPATKTPKDRSPKVPERKSPRSPITEKKRPTRVSELESQLSQLQDDLKKTKDQLNASESSKRQAQQEAEESKKQLMELTSSDDTRVEELTKISHDRDRAWQSELEAVQRQHSMDSAALGTAMNEIQRLKNQLQIVAESEATQINHAESAHEELQRLRMELNETLSLVERIKSEMNDCRHSEAEAMEAAREAQQQLEATSGDSSATAMEVTVDQDATNQLKGEVKSLKYEVGQLKAALEASEARYQVEYIQSTLEIRSAYEQAEKTKQESVEREADLEAELEKAKDKNEGLRSKMEEENQSSEKESELAMQLKKLEHDFTLLKAALLEKETQVKGLAEKNDMLKIEIERGEAAANTEMEAELRRLKVQADQWRKAAEAAASMLSSTGNNNNGNGMNNYNTIAGTMGSPFSEDMDDESPKKKNGNVLKKFGVLWKKGQK
ncbi:unnamed protein product [Linum tenue]|uniref:Uncharacterized protein n=1 Tax=Linum tenue TaxID=586396 RepID=A0AAV0PMT6_9ROSI|nr:unnamed protein product [Linum tenue]